MSFIKVSVPEEPIGESFVLIDINERNKPFTPRTLRDFLHETAKRMDREVYDRLKTDEFILIEKHYFIKTSEEIPEHPYRGGLFYTEGGGFFGGNCRNVSLFMLRDEYNGYRSGFARALREFRKMSFPHQMQDEKSAKPPEPMSLDIIISIAAYRDVVMGKADALDPRGPAPDTADTRQ